MLTDNITTDHKKQILQQKINDLKVIFKQNNLLVYPCPYDEHLKYKSKFYNLIKDDPNIYLIFICTEYKMKDIVSATKAPKNVQQNILYKVLNFYKN